MTNPHPTQLEQAIATLKAEIRDQVSAVVLKFAVRHGISPSGITVNFIENTSLGHDLRTYILGSVDIRFDF